MFATQRVNEEAKCSATCEFTYDDTITPKITNAATILEV